MEYNFHEIEQKWKRYWAEHHTYRVSNKSDKPKFYVLDMFPYPSGAGLHVGHPLGYIASDIFSRYKRLKGFNVLHPMGFDSFGLPAEQYALDTGIHPAVSTANNIKRYKEQFANIGFCYDWEREVQTSDPAYYRWTQWAIVQMFKHYYDCDADKALSIKHLEHQFEQFGNQKVRAAGGYDKQFTAEDWKEYSHAEKEAILMHYRLIYRRPISVNWCPALGTVLANDEIKDGLSERGGHPVEKRSMLQWSLRTTAYGERLLNDLDTIEWTESLKTMQRNWIGKSEGAQLFFHLHRRKDSIEVFTTRPDTIFGATFMVLAPEHKLVAEITTNAHQDEIDDYLKYVQAKSEVERMADKRVTGAFTGAYAINPFTKTKIPIWISEYVLKDYGTGAIMAVPSDDDRDKAFAEKFNLPIIDVVDKSKYPGATLHDKVGIIINSDFLNGMEVPNAIQTMFTRIEALKIGKRRVNYKLRDANFSRQRYWGEPFPFKYDKEGITYAVKSSELPVVLPDTDDFKPSSSASGAKSPLAKCTEWVNLPNGYTRETDTMPAVAGSSWYYLRYMDANNNTALADKEAIKYWQNVDLYVGGTEHAVSHLLYARFWHKFLHDINVVPTAEPFQKLINQGMLQGVIESVYLKKEKTNGHHHIYDSKVLAASNANLSDYIKLYVLISYVTDYGAADSHLNLAGIDKFRQWRPEYADAIFETIDGVYHLGKFEPKGDAKDVKLVTHSEVGKISKSRYNVINPDDVISEFGADCFRMYEMFLGPIEQSKPWDVRSISGVSSFLRKLWSLFYDINTGKYLVTDAEPTKAEWKILHTAIKGITEDIERFSFNTCVSKFMVCVNELKKSNSHKRKILNELVVLLAPFAPFTMEELWEKLGNKPSIFDATFPSYEEAYLKEDSITYPVSINGKKRGDANFPVGMQPKEMEPLVRDLEIVKKWTEGSTIKKVIIVAGRMINIVI
jgi:leucyl-tRNA synthetase